MVRERRMLRAIAEASPNTGHAAGAAAAIVIVMTVEMPKIETYDEGRAAERILAAATALGLASAIGWIMPQGAAALAALLGVPVGNRVRTLVLTLGTLGGVPGAAIVGLTSQRALWSRSRRTY